MPRISPVWMFIVTKAPRRPLAASAPSPALCTLPLIVSSRLSPGTGGWETSLPPAVGSPKASTWIRVTPGLPRRYLS